MTIYSLRREMFDHLYRAQVCEAEALTSSNPHMAAIWRVQARVWLSLAEWSRYQISLLRRRNARSNFVSRSIAVCSGCR